MYGKAETCIIHVRGVICGSGRYPRRCRMYAMFSLSTLESKLVRPALVDDLGGLGYCRRSNMRLLPKQIRPNVFLSLG